MLTFLQVLERLDSKPQRVLPGEERAVLHASMELPSGDAPNTILLLSGGDAPSGVFAGIISAGDIHADGPMAVFPEDTNLPELCREIESMLLDEALFQDAKARLLQTFLETQDVQALVDEVYRLLGLPVTVFDLSTKVVAFAGEAQIRQSGFAPALYVLKRGFAIGYMDEKNFNEQTRRFTQAAEPFVNTYGQEVPRLCCRLMVMNEFAGHVNIMGLRAFRPSDYRIESLLRDLIERLWRLDNRYFKEPAAVLLRDMYDGIFTGNRNALEERLRLLKLMTGSRFCVLFMEPSTASGTHLPMRSLISQFINYGAGEWADKIKFFLRPEGAYCLISLPEEDHLPELEQCVALFLRKNDCRGGLSKVFSDVMEFRIYCDQARRLAYICGRSGKTALGTVESGYWDDLLLCLRGSVEPTVFVDDEVLRLVAYDRTNDSQLMDSMCAYLECSCNISEAAKRLFVHRNTLIRRLERISQLTGYDFDRLPDMGRLLLSAKIVERMNNSGLDKAPEGIL